MTTIDAPVTIAAPPRPPDEHRSARPAVVSVPDAPATPAGLTPLQRRNKALLRFAISITVLNVVGHLVLGFEQPPIVPIVLVLVSYAVSLALEAVDAWAYRRPAEYAGGRSELFYFLLPAHIAAMACAMLLYTSSLMPYVIAVVVAVSSKYLVRVRVRGRLRHVLNPSNTGIAAVLLVMPIVGFTPPYMFLNNTDHAVDVLIPLGVLMLGTMLNAKLTQKMPLILGWVGGYVAQAVLRWQFDGEVLLAPLGTMTGVAFILFTNYMITDPGTTPSDPRRQVFFGVSVAAVYGLLIVAGVPFAIFYALVLTCAARGLVLVVAERVRLARQASAGPVPVTTTGAVR